MSYSADALYQWADVTSTPTPITILNHRAYVCKTGSPSILEFKLPAAAQKGFAFKIVGYSSMWRILQNANQQINLGILSTTPGVTGMMQSTGVTDEIYVICLVDNLVFKATGFANFDLI